MSLRFLDGNPSARRLQIAILRSVAAWTEALWSVDRWTAPGMLIVRPRQHGETSQMLIGGLRHIDAGAQIDAAIAFLRDGGPCETIAWPANPPRPRGLGAYLLARGFDTNWNAHWMLLDLHSTRLEHATPPALTIEQAGMPPADDPTNLPYYARHEVAAICAASRSTDRIRQYYGYMDGHIVAQSALFLTTGAYGIAMIRNVGVLPTANRRGYGTAMTYAALRDARAAGCRFVVLGATDQGRPLYERIGFRSLGYSPSWVLRSETHPSLPVAPAQVALAEAAGLGNLARIEALARTAPELLDALLPNRRSPLEIAVAMGQTNAVEQLIACGATLDLISAWELGWRDRAAESLARHPELANRRYGALALTPLHIATWQGDLDLARLALSAHPDLSVRDTAHHSTPLGWAEFFGRSEIAALIRARLDSV